MVSGSEEEAEKAGRADEVSEVEKRRKTGLARLAMLTARLER